MSDTTPQAWQEEFDKEFSIECGWIMDDELADVLKAFISKVVADSESRIWARAIAIASKLNHGNSYSIQDRIVAALKQAAEGNFK